MHRLVYGSRAGMRQMKIAKSAANSNYVEASGVRGRCLGRWAKVAGVRRMCTIGPLRFNARFWGKS